MKNTLLASMGFEDHDLKTPEHDQIMLWLDANADQVANEAWQQIRFWRAEHLADITFVGVKQKIWEAPAEFRGRSVGFIDMRLLCDGKMDREGDDHRVKLDICIEVKSSIRSIGELIRQVRAYGRPHFVVVCPDDRFSEVIRSQGIAFIKSPSFSTKSQQGLF